MTTRPVVVVDVEYTTVTGATVRERSTLRQARRTLRSLEARHDRILSRPTRTTADEIDEANIGIAADAYRAALHRAGYCRACGRRLTDTVSVGYGYGPDCRARLEAGS